MVYNGFKFFGDWKSKADSILLSLKMRNYSLNRRATISLLFAMYIANYKAFKNSINWPMPTNRLIQATGHIASTAIDVIVAFILALIAALIGVNLIGPVATAVGGALKNGNLTGAANSLTAQITLIFVTVVILGIVVFLALFGKLAGAQAE